MKFINKLSSLQIVATRVIKILEETETKHRPVRSWIQIVRINRVFQGVYLENLIN